MKKLSFEPINPQLTLSSCADHPHCQQVAQDKGIQPDSKFQIRPATVSDLISVSQIMAESFHSQKGLWKWTFPIFRLGIYEDLRHRLSIPTLYNHTCLVAFNASSKTKDIIGTVELGMRLGNSWACMNQRFPYLSNLAVHPNYRRHGVASNLLLICEQISQEWGFQDLYLHVLSNNHQAKQLYFKLGYQVYQVAPPWKVLSLHPSRQIFLHKHLDTHPRN